jgi:hypothetical protein
MTPDELRALAELLPRTNHPIKISVTHLDLAAAAALTAAAQEIERLEQRAAELEQDAARYRAAILWALGGEGSDFRPRMEGEGAYWWRKELRKRAAIDAAMKEGA